ncbi:hypothetical protein [Legionella saoudiensis]|nr:hypothetical protein [Legionella saoudiensis]
MSTTKQGKGSNLTQEDRKKGGEHSHAKHGKGGHQLTDQDRSKGGKNSHK